MAIPQIEMDETECHGPFIALVWYKALRMHYQMQCACINPIKFVIIYVINASGSLSNLQAGMKIHEDIIPRGFEYDVFVSTVLTSMYAKCRSIENACQVFERIPKRDVVTWNKTVAGYFQNDQPRACVHSLSKRINETHSWIVALKQETPPHKVGISLVPCRPWKLLCINLGEHSNNEFHCYCHKSREDSPHWRRSAPLFEWKSSDMTEVKCLVNARNA